MSHQMKNLYYIILYMRLDLKPACQSTSRWDDRNASSLDISGRPLPNMAWFVVLQKTGKSMKKQTSWGLLRSVYYIILLLYYYVYSFIWRLQVLAKSADLRRHAWKPNIFCHLRIRVGNKSQKLEVSVMSHNNFFLCIVVAELNIFVPQILVVFMGFFKGPGSEDDGLMSSTHRLLSPRCVVFFERMRAGCQTWRPWRRQIQVTSRSCI